jgi:phenylpropionate dioxygenase-like ring-hydroxylating dioxygenase large terminal subunit
MLDRALQRGMEAPVFLRNAWYVAAWDHQLAQGLLARTIMNENIVFFRSGDGIAALEDRCCHRSAPLSVGKLIEGGLQCGYHGLVFDRSGRCVRVPGQAKVPPGAAVRSYPVVEKHRWIWIWMGDPAAADQSLIPDMHWHADPAWLMIGDYFNVKCHYQALIDIQLDNTHSKYVHPTSLGNDGAIATPPRVRREPRAVHGERLMPNSDPPPIWRRAIDYQPERADVWLKWTYTVPAAITFDAGIAEPGTGAFEGNRSRGITVYNSHGITPETDRTTHHFWTSSRNFRIDDEAITKTMREIRNTFLEDVAIVEAQQRALEAFPNAPTIDVNADAPTIQARALMAQLIDAERRQGRPIQLAGT